MQKKFDCINYKSRIVSPTLWPRHIRKRRNYFDEIGIEIIHKVFFFKKKLHKAETIGSNMIKFGANKVIQTTEKAKNQPIHFLFFLNLTYTWRALLYSLELPSNDVSSKWSVSNSIFQTPITTMIFIREKWFGIKLKKKDSCFHLN